MKKILSIVLTVLLLLTTASCGSSDAGADAVTSTPEATRTPEPTPEPTPSSTPLPTPTPEPTPLIEIDFFSNDERQAQYKNLYQSYQYSALADYVNEYLSSNEHAETDSAYSILKLINPVLEYESEWVIGYDDFDSIYTLTFMGLDGISSNNSVAISLRGTGLDIKIGFRRGDWLFFDHIALSIDGEQVYTASVRSYDATRNVISGNTIEEYCYCSFYDDVLKQVGNAENVILRFSNNDSGEIFDHKLTQAEMDSLYCGLLLRINNRDLSNLLYRYNNPK